MAILDLSVDEVLSTTRSVRKRLDLTRPVEPEVIRECLELAAQAPTGSNLQRWHFIVVTDQEKRRAIGESYKKGWLLYQQNIEASGGRAARNLAPEQAARMENVVSSSQYLADHMGEVPVLVIPCIYGRTDDTPAVAQAGTWGSILPAAWSFMLAARERGLGTCWTTLHLFFEQEVAEVLDIPYEKIMQTALIPVAYTLGTEFKPGLRVPMEKIVHWDRW